MFEDFENEQATQSKLFLKSEFIDDVLKTASKLNTVKTKNSICSLLELALSEISGDKDENEDCLNLKELDSNQVWALVENYARNSLNELRSFNDAKKSVMILDELKKFNQKDKMLLNKRERSDMDDMNDMDDIEDDQDEEENDNDDEYEDAPLGQNENDILSDDEEEMGEEIIPVPEKKNSSKESKEKKSNRKQKDNFFSFEEMNKFADEGELEMNYNNDEIEQKPKKANDLSDDEIIDDEMENKEFKYEDFFDSVDGKKQKNSKNLDDDDQESGIEYDDEELEDNIFDIENKLMKNKKEEIKQEYKFINKDLNTEIEEIESKMMSKKDWNMKGEATGKERPKASLLENFLDFEVSVKPPPIPTPEYADTLENLIKLRIKEDLFDDPVRKPQIEMNKKNSNFELNFEKDKKGLADIYEEDYAKDVLKITSES